jgi:hypothetical protein
MRLAFRFLIPLVGSSALACATRTLTDNAPISLQGAVQKGPLVIGSSVQVSTIDALGSVVGDAYATQTTNDRGEFMLDSIPSGDILIEGNGNYFNELTGEVSASSLTLRAYHRLDADSNVVVLNLLTQLTSARIVALLAEGSELSAAVIQSEAEIREALGIGVPTGVLDPMIELDLMGAPEFDNAYLLAVSAVFIQAAMTLAGDPGSVDGELQQLIDTVTLDLADGQLQISTLTLLQAAETALDPALVEANLAARALQIGLAGPLPDIDLALDQDHDDAANLDDNCPGLANPTQTDGNDNGSGDACDPLPATALLELSFSPVKRFDFNWMPAAGAEYYQLLESVDTGAPLLQVGGDMTGLSTSLTVPLHFRLNASYVLRACNAEGCTDSAALHVDGSMTESIGYFKASNTDNGDLFGSGVALSGDGTTLAVGAVYEDSSAVGIGGDQANDSALESGAVYVFVRDDQNTWSQQAYIKASNPDPDDRFGNSVALSADGSTLIVSAPAESSNATGVGGNQADDSMEGAGAVYVFVRDGQNAWTQEAYLKASNSGELDEFGTAVALSGDGNKLAVGAAWEDSSATGVGGNQADNSLQDAGATYVFARDGQGMWSQEAYLKASNAGELDLFGRTMVLSGDGNTLAIGASWEDSDAVGIGGDGASYMAHESGAAYVFVSDGQGAWSQQAYVKASNTGVEDWFGWSLALSDDGNVLAVGAPFEDSASVSDQADNTAEDSGAVYVFARAGQVWSQTSYVKAFNSDALDWFGESTVLSADGNILAVGAMYEASGASGLGGDETDNSVPQSGAIYVLTREGQDTWLHEAYLKASNPGSTDLYGFSLVMSDDAGTLAVTAGREDGGATGIGGPTDDSLEDAGAVYVY